MAARLAAAAPGSEVPGLLMAAALYKGTRADKAAQAAAELQVRCPWPDGDGGPGTDPLTAATLRLERSSHAVRQAQLAAFKEAHPTEPPVRLALGLAQVQANLGDYAAAAETLAALPPAARYRPGVVSVLCALCVAADKPVDALAHLDQAIAVVRWPLLGPGEPPGRMLTLLLGGRLAAGVATVAATELVAGLLAVCRTVQAAARRRPRRRGPVPAHRDVG